MGDELWAKVIVFIVVVFGVLTVVFGVLTVIAADTNYDRGYKQGQIDALNGSIHWQLQKQADGQMLWTECENVCANSAEGR